MCVDGAILAHTYGAQHCEKGVLNGKRSQVTVEWVAGLVPYPPHHCAVGHRACDMGCHPKCSHYSCAPGCFQAPQLDSRMGAKV
jgi:hypothetical protein